MDTWLDIYFISNWVMLDLLATYDVIYYVFLVIILMISIGLHEYAHAWTSYKLWDPTPVLQWRLTPNPLKHIDIVWLISVFLIWFWWWRPVQINPTYYKNPTRDETLTAFAGPIMNLLLAWIWMLIMMVYAKIIWAGLQDMLMQWDYVLMFWQLFIQLNIVLAVFNMIALPPLDGFRLIKVLRKSWARFMEKHASIISLWLIILIVSGSPIIWMYIGAVWNFIYRILFMLFGTILF